MELLAWGPLKCQAAGQEQRGARCRKSSTLQQSDSLGAPCEAGKGGSLHGRRAVLPGMMLGQDAQRQRAAG